MVWIYYLQRFSHAVQSKKLPFCISFGYHSLVKQWAHRRISQKYTYVAQWVTLEAPGVSFGFQVEAHGNPEILAKTSLTGML